MRRTIPSALKRRALGSFDSYTATTSTATSLHHDFRTNNTQFRARRFSSSPRAMESATSTFRWLNLEGAGLSMMERLTLEEALLKKTSDNWIIVGRHTVWPPKHIVIPHHNDYSEDLAKAHKNYLLKTLPSYIEGSQPNPNGMIVMGIGGKAEKLLNSRNVMEDQLLVVKRFSGGGTVVMDENAIWTTLIAGRRIHEVDDTTNNILCKPYPRDIMKWTADAVFGPTFDLMNEQTQSQSLPTFSLQEDDYVLKFGGDTGETRKMGGNAQAITGKQGWLHHTSFLWDYEDVNMERYLKLPEKRPDYRVDRSHKDFLVKLKEHYGGSGNGPLVFLEAMKKACSNSLTVYESNWSDVHQEVFGGSDAAMNAWW
eukprot:CAMPEP_0116114954 /NCGR_PEP_ID=MMETSP0329-20121206/247_1 /TAXON_ID=697910 /ORGANISM="Pseudo-nitzschia arenysensis, Strain B593" /LENGTH=368 /DNA_ID=CAMNT_0003608351 /DNA_START=87 /DNA_END=1190 /DNA_ORIENTATION=+